MKDALQPVVVLGAAGRLGATLVQAWQGSFRVLAYHRQQLDITDRQVLAQAVDAWAQAGAVAVVNASGITSLEEAEQHPDRAWEVNARAVGDLARRCAAAGLRLVHFSTDYVFDGCATTPYREEDPTGPLSVYGQSKRAGEEEVLALGGEHLVLRVAWVFGLGKPAFPEQILRRALAGEDVAAIADKWACPTSAEEVAKMLRSVLTREITAHGLFHLCQQGVCTWWEYGREALRIGHEAGWLDRPLEPRRLALREMTAFLAPRPIYTALDTTRWTAVTGQTPRPWQPALREFLLRYFQPAPV